jgi:polyphosphate kinase
MGSADLMPRNLNRRVEVIFPIEDKTMVHHIRDDILNVSLADNVKDRLMLPDGSYSRLNAKSGGPPLNSQVHLIEQRAH